jgi:hypothetical protein
MYMAECFLLYFSLAYCCSIFLITKFIHNTSRQLIINEGVLVMMFSRKMFLIDNWYSHEKEVMSLLANPDL